MAGSFSSPVSKVLKRSLQASHSRRRRIVAPSSETRESMTRVSACWQKGQYMERLAREKTCGHGRGSVAKAPEKGRSSNLRASSLRPAALCQPSQVAGEAEPGGPPTHCQRQQNRGASTAWNRQDQRAHKLSGRQQKQRHQHWRGRFQSVRSTRLPCICQPASKNARCHGQHTPSRTPCEKRSLTAAMCPSPQQH
ncbi:hypothetical protein G6F55_013701 [Rhizopus delemar]|nr:hypothetical protein G6F55_013701 [Rhizopus delemar]